MIKIERVTGASPAFAQLIRHLDADLKERDGEEHSFYAQFNKADTIAHVVIAYDHDTPIACGALRAYDRDTVEIKRMFTTTDHRGKGIGSQILKNLEKWASQLGYARCILETGKRQPEAIGLYQKNGYVIIPNYGQYATVEQSLCFEKKLY
ncbi:GNAT family N-acetyltransferase [Sinomicrobium oceani]|uniref:GNAT family N-acetyltransferase n=1 Tax=Sinomicrobium oceani TaxID=1150368 RepID=UPI00227CF973|nr:GNAT family N-acetyltransferase [Sinomicrobium oceani]